MKRIIIMGSPRSNGRSSHLAEMLFEANIDERPEDELFLVPVSEIEVGPCVGCNACRQLTEVTVKDEDGNERTEMLPRCVFDDDMQTVYDLLDDADELTIVSPVYFSGAPAMLKCLLDRMQPYYWAQTRKAPKRPATLHVLGEGGDPHGYDPLVSEVKSSIACAGFRLERIFDWVGKIGEDGEIAEEATEINLVAANAEEPETPESTHKQAPQQKKERPKLDLSSGKKKPQQAGQGGRQSSQKKAPQANQKKGKRRG